MATETHDPTLCTGDHAVQFFHDDADLARVAGSYVANGVLAGEVAIVIATSAHRRAIELELEAAGVDLAEARRQENLITLDACATLSKLTVGGRIDRTAFRAVVGALVGETIESGRTVRAFGEMVALLWNAGDVLGAIELESLWNELGQELPFSLLCAYQSSSVTGTPYRQALREVCDAHSVVLSPPSEIADRDGAFGDLGLVREALEPKLQGLSPDARARRGRAMSRDAHRPVSLGDVRAMFEPVPAHGMDGEAYERRTSIFQDSRDLVVRALPLRSGDVVLDLGCGTGACLPGLVAKVGATGTVMGIDMSPMMLAFAQTRVCDYRWSNVELVGSSVESAVLPVGADAALFCGVHDVLQSRGALDNVFSHLRPGAWVAALGAKAPASWLPGLSGLVRAVQRPFITDFTGFDRPWRLLAEYLNEPKVYSFALGTGFLVLGQTPRRATG